MPMRMMYFPPRLHRQHGVKVTKPVCGISISGDHRCHGAENAVTTFCAWMMPTINISGFPR